MADHRVDLKARAIFGPQGFGRQTSTLPPSDVFGSPAANSLRTNSILTVYNSMY